MMQILKVIGRVILISFGLVCIAAGGLCTVIGSTSGAQAAWVAMIGIVSLLVGVAIVWAIIRNWRAEQPATETPEKENP
jgi:hypothetical protein